MAKANVLHDETLIKAWREHFGLTEAELAVKAGIQQASPARLETGKTTPRKATPRKATLAKLAKAMGLVVEQLME